MSNATRQVTVIADSTADIPASLLQELNIPLVPLRISFGEESFRDGLELSTDAFIERLIQSEALPTTSQPTINEFATAFQDELAKGHSIVCITIGAGLSGTHNAARMGAEQLGTDRIAVIDGGSTTMQLGWVVVEAARSAALGSDKQTVQTVAEQAVERTNLFAVL